MAGRIGRKLLHSVNRCGGAADRSGSDVRHRYQLAIDHFGWMGIATKPVTWTNAIGFLLVFAGVLLIKFK